MPPSAPLTPRQRVQAALAHRQPDRVPFSWGFGPTPEMARALDRYLAERGINWARLRALTEDILPIAPSSTAPTLPPSTDIWGIVRSPMSYGPGVYDEIRLYPLANLATAQEVSAYPWPDPQAYDHANLRARIMAADPAAQRARKLDISVCGNPLEIYCWMTGLERALENLLLKPQIVHAALEQITHFFEERLRLSLERCGDLVDLLFFADDLGSQRGLLISRRTYREMVQPYHRRLMRLAKGLAPQAKVMFHTDGAAFDILPDLIEAGVEVLEAVQTDAAGMTPTGLKATYGGQLSFHGGISVQQLLPCADAKTVEAECRRLVEVFGQNGGYIAAPAHAIQVGTPPENVLALLRGVLGDKDYREAIDGAR